MEEHPIIAKLVAGKKAYRQTLANLPPEEKVRILIELQKLANSIRKATERPLLPVWPN